MSVKHAEARLVMMAVLVAVAAAVTVKECKNTGTELSSHTARARRHLNPTDEAAWMDLMPPHGGLRAPAAGDQGELDWTMLYRSLKGQLGGAVSSPSSDRRTPPSAPAGRSWRRCPCTPCVSTPTYGDAQLTNVEYLLMLDPDRLVWSFRSQAGLPAPGEPCGGWEHPDMELRGHFVGHYMSATAKMWARWRRRFRVLQIMRSLLDQHVVAGNGKALGMVVAMADYFAGRVSNVTRRYSIERHWMSLNEEAGGMNDVLYQLDTITVEGSETSGARRLFDKPCFLGLLAVQADSLSNFHANTHIPVVIGGQMRYEVTDDPLYKEAATFFMDIVNFSHAYAIGGTSVSDFWFDPKRLAEALTTKTEEDRIRGHYSGFNGVLSFQRGRDPGVMIYMLAQGPGRSKARSYRKWGTPYDSFWCCYGTEIESFSKLGDSIYFEEKGLTVTQKLMPLSSSDQYLQVSFSISTKTDGQFAALTVRMPSWTSLNGAMATLNDKDLKLASPGTFLTISKQWASGDQLSLQLPIHLRTEAIKDHRPEYASIQAVLFGPFLLAGLTTGDWDAKTGGATAAASDWITPSLGIPTPSW
ncbi:hypothetical protein BS78_08G007800 [Paspalum vaginatum]|nr:hypothetical protein BS78_08G007800 [Paspalum vaginatum]